MHWLGKARYSVVSGGGGGGMLLTRGFDAAPGRWASPVLGGVGGIYLV